MSAHAKYSASKFEVLALCPGSIVLAKDAPRTATIYSAEGTAAHELMHIAGLAGRSAREFLGYKLEADGYEFVVDEEMAGYVDQTLDLVRGLAGDDGTILWEQRVTYADALGVDRELGWGTADVLIVRGERLFVVDLKYGRGVAVSAESPQLKLYGLGALDMVDGVLGDIEAVELIISQPRSETGTINALITTPAELYAWAEDEARFAVNRVQNAELTYRAGSPQWEEHYLNPGEKQCRFCPAKGSCPALRQEVAAYVSGGPANADEFQEITDPRTFSEPDLARAMGAVELIEGWCKGVRAEVERRLLASVEVRGWKLVEGRAGNRKWSDAAVAEQTMAGMRLKKEEMYEYKLISPTTAEKLLAKESPRRWAKLQELIVREPGKPSVAPISDPRPAIPMITVAEEFDSIA